MYKTVTKVTCPPEFNNRCPVSWRELLEIADTENRWCSVCRKQVHRTDDPSKLEELARDGECVAVLYEKRMLLGSIAYNDTNYAKGSLTDVPPK